MIFDTNKSRFKKVMDITKISCEHTFVNHELSNKYNCTEVIQDKGQLFFNADSVTVVDLLISLEI